MKHEESAIQRSCIKWFDYQYSAYNKTLFAVPNSGSRSKVLGGLMRAEGMRSGVADLIFLKANKQYNALCIEMKIKGGKQSDNQKDFQSNVEINGSKYVICYSLEDFMKEITNYLANL